MSFTEVHEQLPALTVEQRQLLIRRALELDDPTLGDADEQLVDGRAAQIPPPLALPQMNWRVEFAPQVELDVVEAADWYERRQRGLGAQFVEEIIRVWDALETNPCSTVGATHPS